MVAPSLNWRICLKAARVVLTLGLEICYAACSACGLVFCDEVQQAGKLARLHFDCRSVRRVFFLQYFVGSFRLGESFLQPFGLLGLSSECWIVLS